MSRASFVSPRVRAYFGFLAAIVLVIAGVAIGRLWFTWWQLGDIAVRFHGLGVASAAALVAALALTLDGARVLLRPAYLDDRDHQFPSLEDLPEAVRATSLPVWVCTRCRIIAPLHATMGPCPRCDSGVDCHRVDDESDRVLVLSLI